ncbi:unnamed protein product [Nesidiocoris tenuis]|uniref:Uncharacterized protein n=1 Tax=Nesidiocoris tenuis TaxID=355587 RepID=A0A6H5GN55_9HEMI|nr:unnamed protein product [Nesidiocoris tenuis]
MKLHKRTCARVVDSRNRSAYGLLSRAGRLVKTSAMLVRAAKCLRTFVKACLVRMLPSATGRSVSASPCWCNRLVVSFQALGLIWVILMGLFMSQSLHTPTVSVGRQYRPGEPPIGELRHPGALPLAARRPKRGAPYGPALIGPGRARKPSKKRRRRTIQSRRERQTGESSVRNGNGDFNGNRNAFELSS